MGRFEGPVVAPGETDLLVLAEAILRKRDMTTLSEGEREAIEQSVKVAQEDLAWPAGETGTVEAKQPGEGAAAPSPDDRAISEARRVEKPEAEAPLSVGVAGPVLVTGVPSWPAGGGAESPDEQGLDLRDGQEVVTLVPRFDESELVPNFEGEPIEDSLGWVSSAAELEEGLATEEPVVVEEAPWEEVEDWEAAQQADKKKKAKKAGKTRRTPGRGDSWVPYGGLDKTQKRKPPRSRS